MRSLNQWKVPFACALALTSLRLALIVISRSAGASGGKDLPLPMLAAPTTGPNVAEASLSDALGRHWLRAGYVGNGSSEVKATFVNLRNTPLRLTVAAGLIFETPNFRDQMVVARGQTIELAAKDTRPAWLACAATRSTNALKPQDYHLCPETLQALTPLFAQVDKSPEVSRQAIQTAVLLLNENAPMVTFAKFNVLSGDTPLRPATPAYQVNTGEILAAFALLKDAGYPRRNLVAAQDPQLEIEAMIDPLAHASAVSYYHLNNAQEWAFWRDELQKGDLSTRHYALYGIGRYYPDVALQMLPDWARASQLSPLMRTSAIQAMAETHRPEAISVLQGLVSEFGAATELGESARKSIAYLENQRTAPVSNTPVEFKVSQATLR